MRIILNPIVNWDRDDVPPKVEGTEITYRGVTFTPSAGFANEFCRISEEGGVLVVILDYEYDQSKSKPNQPSGWENYTFDKPNEIQCPILRI